MSDKQKHDRGDQDIDILDIFQADFQEILEFISDIEDTLVRSKEIMKRLLNIRDNGNQDLFFEDGIFAEVAPVTPPAAVPTPPLANLRTIVLFNTIRQHQRLLTLQQRLRTTIRQIGTLARIAREEREVLDEIALLVYEREIRRILEDIEDVKAELDRLLDLLLLMPMPI